jgi:hypothetical protein
MKRLTNIFQRLFGSLPGLLVVVVVWEALLVATLTPFSGPLQSLGLADLLNLDFSDANRVGRIELLNLDFSDANRVGRIIMLYHSLAIPFVASLVYLILDQVPSTSLA